MNNQIGTVISKSTFASDTLPIHNSRFPSLSHSLHLSIPRTHQKKKTNLNVGKVILIPFWNSLGTHHVTQDEAQKIWLKFEVNTFQFVRSGKLERSFKSTSKLSPPPPLGPILQSYFHSTYHQMGIRWKFVHVMDNFAKYKWIGEISISIFF